MSEPVWKTEIPDLPPPRRGKVRDVYDLGEFLLIVACDRISAYDVVMTEEIPDKGKVLTGVSVSAGTRRTTGTDGESVERAVVGGIDELEVRFVDDDEGYTRYFIRKG